MEKDKKDIKKETDTPEWHCDIYCRKVRHVDCEGKEHINPDSPNMCPYFDEMLY